MTETQRIRDEDLTAYLDECYEANGGADITYFEISVPARRIRS